MSRLNHLARMARQLTHEGAPAARDLSVQDKAPAGWQGQFWQGERSAPDAPLRAANRNPLQWAPIGQKVATLKAPEIRGTSYTMTIDRLRHGCPLPRPFLETIQQGTMQYTYKGVPTYKNPFDLALYQLLLWEQKPQTLIEIGSKWGGSALWFADVLGSFAIDYRIHSVDLDPPAGLAIPGVTFHRGDARDLSQTFSSAMLETLPRPVMIVEDADHRPATTLATLHFFDQWVRPGEYIVIEDGIVDELFDDPALAQLEGGPRPAIESFLLERGGDYTIDARFCDYFGTNMTWNVNGYLRRVR